jgi:long-chain acyl-CoA synthetase
MLFGGVNVIFSSDPSPVRFLQLADYWKAQSLSAPPAYFEAILGLPMLMSFNRNSVRRIMTGMDFFSTSLMRRLCDAFPQVTSAANGYGLVETSTIFMHWKGETRDEILAEPKPFTIAEGCGTAIDVRDAEDRSADHGMEGELVVRGDSVVSSYLGNHPENPIAFRDGWFRTGDSARKVNAASVVLLGRKKYLIKRGGKSVSPLVVQTHINAYPDVLQSAVIGVPHQLYGEMIWCYVVRKTGRECALKDIMKHCRASLASHMVPDQIRFVDEIPKKQGVGKIDIEALLNLAAKDLVSLQGEQNG